MATCERAKDVAGIETTNRASMISGIETSHCWHGLDVDSRSTRRRADWCCLCGVIYADLREELHGQYLAGPKEAR